MTFVFLCCFFIFLFFFSQRNKRFLLAENAKYAYNFNLDMSITVNISLNYCIVLRSVGSKFRLIRFGSI